MGLVERWNRIFKSEVNAATDKVEDPTHMAEQILRELHENLQQAIEGEAEIKAESLQHRANETKSREAAAEWERKANDLLDRVEAKTLDEAKGNELANVAATNVASNTKDADASAKLAIREEQAVAVTDAKIKKIREQITQTEQKVQMLKSESKTAEVSEKINKTLSSVDTDGLMETLNRMEAKVNAQEFRAQAYAEISDSTMSSSQEIDKVLENSHAGDALAALKAKRVAKTTTV